MPTLPETVKQAWEQRNGPVVLTTVDDQGTPNAIYASCVGCYDDETLIVADNYFDKTRRNLQANGGHVPGAILFITADNKAYQVKGRMEYHTSGPVFEHMKSWNSPDHPGVAAAALKVEAIFHGAEKLL